MTLAIRALIGVAIAGGISLAGFRARTLVLSGAIAATIVGAVAVAAGWSWAVMLFSYFAVSSALSKLGSRQKRARLAGVVDKTGARDATQVLANGFPFLAAALLALRFGVDRPLWMAVAAGSLAASAADTWSTEIGTLVGQTPRSILNGKRLTVGESGGVTLAGWLAAIAGAAFVAAVARWCEWPGAVVVPIIVGGVSGAAADSVVGAALQRRSWCDACGQMTEMRVHRCGTPSRHVGGLAWLENDGVNLVATTTGAVIAGLVVGFGAGAR